MLVLGLAASGAIAGEAAGAPAAPKPATTSAPAGETGGWTFSVAPYMWGAGLNGNAGIGGG